MTAAIKIYELTASKAGTDKTSGTVRFKMADDQTANTSNRMEVPSSGTNYSFTKQLRMYVATAPSVDLQTLAAYTDGANGFGTGVTCEYDTLLGTSFAANATTDIAGTDIFTRGAATVIDMDTGLASTEFLGTGFKGLILRSQLLVADTAGAGTLDSETITFSYSET